ncbi:MAG: M28 family peptidase, partial [Chloroflexi bacterium]|nr:M28 family peptidase [Chloroflexota bacterium]
MNVIDRMLEQAVVIQQIAAPTFAEARRAEYVRDQFQAAGLREVEIDTVGNVYACRPGARGHAPVVVSAHTDTVFPAQTELTLRRDANPSRLVGPGIGDNSLGVAALLGLVWALDADR